MHYMCVRFSQELVAYTVRYLMNDVNRKECIHFYIICLLCFYLSSL